MIGEYDKALEDLTKLLEIESDNIIALRYRGEIYHIMGRYEESLVDLDRLLEININETLLEDLNELLEININIAWVLHVYEEVARK